MFTLSEIKNIRKQYQIDSNGDVILDRLHNKDNELSSKLPSEMTADEKSYIESALFLYNKVRIDHNHPVFKDLSEEEFLEQIQTEFTSEALSRTEYTASTMGATTKTNQVIWKSLMKEESGSMAYFNRILAENGKKMQNFQKSGINGLSMTIKYDLIDDRKGKFLQNLNPNNPMYTQNPKSVQLTPEQAQRRRQFVDKLMQVYRQCEKDENYENRALKEEKDMAFVVKAINNNNTITTIPEPATVNVMNLLYAAQNVSLNGERDYLGEILDQPKISEFLLKMKNENILDRMEKAAQERKDNGTISEHQPTHGELTIREANSLISEHPNAVKVAKGKLDERSSFVIDKGNKDNLRRARLLEVVARTQGKSINRTTDENGNRILQVDDGKEQSK